MLKKNNVQTITMVLILFAGGIFKILNTDFLFLNGWLSDIFGFVDDWTFGIAQIILGSIILYAFLRNKNKTLLVGYILFGSMMFSVSIIYFVQIFQGFLNVTWIYTLGMFVWTLTNTYVKESDLNELINK